MADPVTEANLTKLDSQSREFVEGAMGDNKEANRAHPHGKEPTGPDFAEGNARNAAEAKDGHRFSEWVERGDVKATGVQVEGKISIGTNVGYQNVYVDLAPDADHAKPYTLGMVVSDKDLATMQAAAQRNRDGVASEPSKDPADLKNALAACGFTPPSTGAAPDSSHEQLPPASCAGPSTPAAYQR